MKKSAAIIGGIAAYVAVTAGAYMPFVISDARKEFNDKCEYLLILGGDIIGEETPSPQLLDRMRTAEKIRSGDYSKLSNRKRRCKRKNSFRG